MDPVGLLEAPYKGRRVIFENSLMFRVMRGSSVHQTKASRAIDGRERGAGHVAPGSEPNPSHTKRNSQPSPTPPPPHWLRCLMSAFLHSYAQNQAWPRAKVCLAEVRGRPGKRSFSPVTSTFGPVQPCKWHQPEGPTGCLQKYSKVVSSQEIAEI